MDVIERKLGRAISRAIVDFGMIDDGDRIMVAVSGGKDSYAMLYLLRELQKKAPVAFTLKVVNNGAAKPIAVAEPSDSTLTARNQQSIEPNCDSPRCRCSR